MNPPPIRPALSKALPPPPGPARTIPNQPVASRGRSLPPPPHLAEASVANPGSPGAVGPRFSSPPPSSAGLVRTIPDRPTEPAMKTRPPSGPMMTIPDEAEPTPVPVESRQGVTPPPLHTIPDEATPVERGEVGYADGEAATWSDAEGHGQVGDTAPLADAWEAGQETTIADEGLIPSERAPSEGLSVGAVLAGRYQVERLLGAGGMALVYLARDLKFKGQPVALKVLHVGLGNNPVVRQRFENEAVLARSLQHPNVVPIYDIFETETGRLCIAMAYLEGANFREWLAGNRSREDFLPKALSVVRDVCGALEHAHKKGAVHRDVKPDNVFVTHEEKVLVMDFGIAKLLQEIEGTAGYATTHHVTQSVVGTPAYMAPEQFEAGAEIDGRADQYAVGVMLYEVLTARLPSGRFKLPSEVVPGLSGFYDRLIEKSLAQDPNQRFPEMGAFLAELEKAPDLPKQGGGWKLSPHLLAASALGLGVAVALVLFYLQHSLLLFFIALSGVVPMLGLCWLDGAARSGGREAALARRMLWGAGLLLAVLACGLLWEKSW